MKINTKILISILIALLSIVSILSYIQPKILKSNYNTDNFCVFFPIRN
jgi:hypothetical protein